ncbi:hypothetical protein A8F94_00370 [Bacillus sp. FJAT-27225]|uniref:hypothetical protein n=1 Tax=Bacillus sp. FJAT-27225 TaxID=1743144 RepID=UPI00080C264A|nr:hypothetical protein [Bacillus sp. FJAT-27225]OCA90387.1 hypothetical protein A8F94_00370 [Bacillus sp. FJAT-27225]
MQQRLCNEAIPYLKQIIRENIEYEQPILSNEDRLVDINFNEDLTITFLVNDSDTELFKYVQFRDLQLEQINSKTLLDIGINNLYSLAEENGLRIQELDDDCSALLLDGNFEATLVLLDDLWDNTLNQYAPDGFAVAIPSRDVLAFCNLNSNKGIQKLKNVISNVWENGEYLLTDKILKRNEGKWTF